MSTHPPMFPRNKRVAADGVEVDESEGGATIHDMFMAAAITGMMAATERGLIHDVTTGPHYIVRNAKAIADEAMRVRVNKI